MDEPQLLVIFNETMGYYMSDCRDLGNSECKCDFHKLRKIGVGERNISELRSYLWSYLHRKK